MAWPCVAIAELPPTPARVIRMRDVEGYRSEEVCAALDVSKPTSASSSTARARACATRSRGTWMADATADQLQEVVES